MSSQVILRRELDGKYLNRKKKLARKFSQSLIGREQIFIDSDWPGL